MNKKRNIASTAIESAYKNLLCLSTTPDYLSPLAPESKPWDLKKKNHSKSDFFVFERKAAWFFRATHHEVHGLVHPREDERVSESPYPCRGLPFPCPEMRGGGEREKSFHFKTDRKSARRGGGGRGGAHAVARIG